MRQRGRQANQFRGRGTCLRRRKALETRLRRDRRDERSHTTTYASRFTSSRRLTFSCFCKKSEPLHRLPLCRHESRREIQRMIDWEGILRVTGRPLGGRLGACWGIVPTPTKCCRKPSFAPSNLPANTPFPIGVAFCNGWRPPGRSTDCGRRRAGGAGKTLYPINIPRPGTRYRQNRAGCRIVGDAALGAGGHQPQTRRGVLSVPFGRLELSPDRRAPGGLHRCRRRLVAPGRGRLRELLHAMNEVSS